MYSIIPMHVHVHVYSTYYSSTYFMEYNYKMINAHIHVRVLPSSSLDSGGLSTGFQSAAASTITSSTSRPRLKHIHGCVWGGGWKREGVIVRDIRF